MHIRQAHRRCHHQKHEQRAELTTARRSETLRKWNQCQIDFQSTPNREARRLITSSINRISVHLSFDHGHVD